MWLTSEVLGTPMGGIWGGARFCRFLMIFRRRPELREYAPRRVPQPFWLNPFWLKPFQGSHKGLLAASPIFLQQACDVDAAVVFGWSSCGDLDGIDTVALLLWWLLAR